MKNMLKKNKKGFTLVELLAVIVILALLIVITANTVIPMMTKSKKSGMLVYAERVFNNAATSFQADNITTGSAVDNSKYYSIKEIMGADDYYGCVKVTGTTTSYTFSIIMYDKSNKLKLEGFASKATINATADDVVVSWGNTENFVVDSYKTNGLCRATGTNSLSAKLDGYTSSSTGANKLVVDK